MKLINTMNSTNYCNACGLYWKLMNNDLDIWNHYGSCTLINAYNDQHLCSNCHDILIMTNRIYTNKTTGDFFCKKCVNNTKK